MPVNKKTRKKKKATIKKPAKAPAAKKKVKKTKTRAVKKTRTKTSGITEETKVKRHPNVASRTIDGQEVVIVPSSRKLQMLNDVATRIWALCDGRSVKSIAEIIWKEYKVTKKAALKDVKEFVAQILKRGMVEIK